VNEHAFVTALAHQLDLHGLVLDHADLRAFVANAWPLIPEDSDVQRWAPEYAERAHLAFG
jgi:hypothetical protein